MKRVTSVRRHPKQGPLLAQAKGLMRQFGLKARKGLGQHFLIDETVLQLIVSAAGLTPDDVVVEIGPGLGVLTRELARQAGWVIAIEIDSKLAAILRQTLAPVNNVSIINNDILNIDPADLSPELAEKLPAATGRPFKYKVVANLPYYITSPVLRHLLEATVRPELMVVMAQKEVAETIAARPGKMSLLSVSVQFYGEPYIVGLVPARCFYPEPEVDSAILRINVYRQPPIAAENTPDFFRLVRAGFSAARKQIVNSLALGLGLPKAEVSPLLGAAGIAPQRRAETLTLDEWISLWQASAGAGEPAC
jgi:16S rRNA (adenine1518-N6/adenine1519-N6)-dimethyltransferase